MPVKPDSQTEALALTIVSHVEAQRATLMQELESIGKSGVSMSAPQQFPTLERVRSGQFLSKRMAHDVLTGVSTGALDNCLGDLRALQCNGELAEYVRVIYAYFLKYRFLDLSDVVLPPPQNTGFQPGMERVQALPVGWDTLALDVRLASSATGSAAMEMLPSRLTSAPWLGALRPLPILQAVVWLTECGLLEFGDDAFIHVVASAPRSTVPVLRMNDSTRLGDSRLQALVDSARSVAANAEKARAELVVDCGAGLRLVGAYETYQLIAESTTNDVLRIGTYHLRSVVGERKIADWLVLKPTLRLRILCLGPTTIEALTEGADPTSLIKSLSRGIQSFSAVRRSLPKALRKNVDFRIYGDAEDEAYFRGAILSDSSENGASVKRIVATTWPYGETRANYGEVLILNGNSNTARLIVTYFDRAWDNAIPILYVQPLESLKWVVRSMRAEFLSALVVGVIALAILALTVTDEKPFSLDSDAVFTLVGVLPVLLIGGWRAGRRLIRSLELAIAASRNVDS